MMLDLYTWSTPNGQKASIMLEESGLPYRVTAVDISKGEQHDPEYRRISPNGKIPALVDHDAEGAAGQPRRIFESGNILIYLAEKNRAVVAPGRRGPHRGSGLAIFPAGPSRPHGRAVALVQERRAG